MIETATLMCMALNIYFEARNQPEIGQIAVSNVVINRVESPRYPNTICGVVQQAVTYSNGFPHKYKCQFSWFCDGKSDIPNEEKAWEDAKNTAYLVLNEDVADYTLGATHYHATYVEPDWAEEMVYIKTIGDHMFYKMK